jgi:hypothetical protein
LVEEKKKCHLCKRFRKKKVVHKKINAIFANDLRKKKGGEEKNKCHLCKRFRETKVVEEKKKG